MNELIKYINNCGWYGGEIKVTVDIKRRFEGYHGKASETWETVYTITSHNTVLTDNGKTIIIPNRNRS